MRTTILTTIILSTFLTACASYKTTQEKFVAVDANIAAVDAKVVAVETKEVNLESAVNNLVVANQETLAIAKGKFVYTAETPEQVILFENGKSVLSEAAKKQLSDLVNRLQAENRNVYLEIQGHTDSMASTNAKKLLGANRAESVRLFLNQKGVDLNRMSTISYEDQLPVESNKTAAGRMANRRVVVKIVN